jgi:U3 small nucleolar ribonucleoprotein protein IMP4
VVTFANNNDFISFRHHTWEADGHKQVALAEVGPRFEMRLYKIILGAVDMQQAETEYALRNFMNTANKRTVL